MTKKLRIFVLLCAFWGLAPSIVWAEQTPVKISTSYNNDSDGVSYISYSIATEKKKQTVEFFLFQHQHPTTRFHGAIDGATIHYPLAKAHQ